MQSNLAPVSAWTFSLVSMVQTRSRSIDPLLLLCSPQGYLAAVSASAYSLVSMVQRFGPHMNPGGAVISLTYNASNQTIPGYGGGMSSAKAVSGRVWKCGHN